MRLNCEKNNNNNKHCVEQYMRQSISPVPGSSMFVLSFLFIPSSYFFFSFNRNRNHKCFLFPIRLLNNKWDDAFKSARNDKYLFPFAIGFKDETFHVKNASFFPSLSLLLCSLFFFLCCSFCLNQENHIGNPIFI